MSRTGQTKLLAAKGTTLRLNPDLFILKHDHCIDFALPSLSDSDSRRQSTAVTTCLGTIGPEESEVSCIQKPVVNASSVTRPEEALPLPTMLPVVSAVAYSRS